MHAAAQDLIEKMRMLPPDRLSGVADFVGLIQSRERGHGLTRAASAASAPAFALIWDDPEDSAYDAPWVRRRGARAVPN